MNRHRVDCSFHLSTPEELLAPYRTLALRVISLAVRDLSTPGHSASERKSALTFLSGSRMLTHWCRLADIDPEAIRKRMQNLVDNSCAGFFQRRPRVRPPASLTGWARRTSDGQPRLGSAGLRS